MVRISCELQKLIADLSIEVAGNFFSGLADRKERGGYQSSLKRPDIIGL